MKTLHTRFLALALLASPVAAQVAWTVPPRVPVGSPVPVVISNDTPQKAWVGQACPYIVRNAEGAVVYDLPCPTFVAIPVPPFGGVVDFHWGQHDNAGNPVPPGKYTITIPGIPSVPHPLEIGGTDAALATLGAVRIGAQRHLELMAPGAGGLSHLVAASFSDSPGVPTCGGLLPLTPDLLFALSLDPSSGFPSDGFGVLAEAGTSQAPALFVPKNPNFVGTSFFLAFATLGAPLSACPLERVSTALPVTILP